MFSSRPGLGLVRGCPRRNRVEPNASPRVAKIDRVLTDSYNLRVTVDARVDQAIRRVPDFPKPGILFYDLTSLIADIDTFRYVLNRMEEHYAGAKLDAVAAIESRGFLFAAPFADRRGLPLLLIRKAGKLPGNTLKKDFSLEYGTDTIEVHTDDIPAGGRVLVVDDLIATGGTVSAACELVEDAGAIVHGVFAVVALPFLDYDKKIGSRNVTYLHAYASE